MAEVRDTATMTLGDEAARVGLRTAGYCSLCNRIVERTTTGECPAGHAAESVAGRIVLAADDPLPVLPQFNLAAFLIPPIWGPGNKQWSGALFLPMWLFADSFVTASLTRGAAAIAAAIALVLATIGMQLFYARHANGLAWRAVADRVDLDAFLKKQRAWAVSAVPIALLILGWGIGYHLVGPR